jgi:hypothetical protein
VIDRLKREGYLLPVDAERLNAAAAN